MRKNRSIWNKLSKKELVHVIENCLVDDPLYVFNETRKAQKEMEQGKKTIACFECRIIAKNLIWNKGEHHERNYYDSIR